MMLVILNEKTVFIQVFKYIHEQEYVIKLIFLL